MDGSSRMMDGCKVLVKDAKSSKLLATINEVHKGMGEDHDDELPTRYNLEKQGLILQGPGEFDIEFIANGGC